MADAPPKKTTSELADKEENVTDDEDVVRKTRIEHSQCVLSSLFGSSPSVRNPRTQGGNKYKNFIIMDAKDPSTMISLIHGIKEADEFFRMPTKLASHLVPKIRLFFLDSKNNKDEVLFTTSDSIAANPDSQLFSIMSDNNKGGDAGIVEVQIEDLTSQPEEETNSLVCKIKLFFRTFSTFTNPKTASASGTRTYAELVTRKDSRNASFDPLDNRIQLHVGYNIPDIDPTKLDISNERFKMIKKAIIKSTRVLNLTLREHMFNFNQDGSVELDITYNAALDGIYRDMRTDLLQTHKSQKRITELQSHANKLNKKKNKSDKDKERGLKIAQQIRKIRANQKDEAMAQFIDKLFGLEGAPDKPENQSATYMKKIQVPQELIGAINDKENIKSAALKSKRACDEYSKLLNVVAKVGVNGTSDKVDAGKELSKALKNNKTTGAKDDPKADKRKKSIEDANGKFSIKTDAEVNPNVKKGIQDSLKGTGVTVTEFVEIAFFHYGDILEVAMDIMKRPGSPFHETYIKGQLQDAFPTPILGPLMIRESFCDGEVTRRSGGNIADLPISVDFFVDFMTLKFIKPARNNLLFRDFVGMLNKEMLPGCLGETCRQEESGRMIHFAHSMPITVKKTSAKDPCLGFAGKSPGNFINEKFAKKRFNYVGSISSPKGSDKTKEYMLIYIPGYVPSLLPGKREADLGKGIYHLYAGQPESSILSFSIDGNNQPFMAEAKTFPSDGAPNLGGDISGGARFDLNVEMLGNTFFRIGHYFFLDLSSVGLGATNKAGSLAERLGIGGYYTCNKINYSVTPSDFIVKLKGLFQGGGKTIRAKQKSQGAVKPTDKKA